MGNAAYIIQSGTHTGVYLHWNGGRDSVEAFLEYCKLKGFSGFETGYGLARFCQVVGNFFGTGASIGIVTDVYPDDASGADNGIYSVKGWKIVNRYHKGSEQFNHDRCGFLKAIDAAQPDAEQFGADYFDAEELPPSEIKPGDTVYFIHKLDGKCTKQQCVGIGEDRMVNGSKVEGIPYIDRFNLGPDNINNYLRDASYRVIRQKEG